MNLNRRAALKRFGVAGSVALAPKLAAQSTRRVERVGVQLYTVRDLMAKDVAATLAAVAEAGYVEVETAGTGNLTARQFTVALKNAGLSAPAAHVPLNLMADSPDSVLEAAQTIGYEYIVLPWLAPEQRNAAGYRQAIDVLNRFGERSQQAGVQLCYHNHDFEFDKMDGQVVYDVMLRECDRELVKFELDLFWAAHANADAAAYLRSDPMRFPLCHVKDRNTAGEMVSVGKGNIDFPALFAAGSGVQHYFVEHDQPQDSLASIRDSIAAVQKMRF